MRTKLIFFFLLVFVCFFSCEEIFIPEVSADEELLVVDGMISDAPGPYTIKLSKSASIRQLSRFVPYDDCKVSIEDDLGNKVTLVEKGQGVYQTDAFTFRAVVDRIYKLYITTPDGDLYESTEEVLLKPVAIKAVYAELEHKEDAKYHFGRDGYQFYLDTEPQQNSNNFFLWRIKSTYKFKADLPIHSYYANGKRNPVRDGDSLRICYRNKDILDIFTLNANVLNQSEVKRMPLNYEDNYTKALTLRYSLKVFQYTINERAFNYWNTIKKIRDMQGDLYSQQPHQVNSNLINRTHPEKIALGYFTVAGCSEKRIFVNRPPVNIRYAICTLLGDGVKHLDDKLNERPDLWPFFLVDPQEYGGDFWVDQECVDCRKEGTLEKPPYWID